MTPDDHDELLIPSDTPRDRLGQTIVGAQLQQAAEERSRQYATARRRRRRRTQVAVAFALLGLAIPGVVIGRKSFIDDGKPVPSERNPPSSVTRAPGDRRIGQARAADPDGGPPWGVRQSTNPQGQRCLIVGRIVNHQLGIYNSGQFRPFPLSTPNNACDRGSDPLFEQARGYASDSVAGSRFVVWGFADRPITALQLKTSAGTKPVPIAGDNTFVAVLRGQDALRGVELLISDGTRTRVRRIG
jgi:hypothetical protein